MDLMLRQGGPSRLRLEHGRKLDHHLLHLLLLVCSEVRANVLYGNCLFTSAGWIKVTILSFPSHRDLHPLFLIIALSKHCQSIQTDFRWGVPPLQEINVVDLPLLPSARSLDFIVHWCHLPGFSQDVQGTPDLPSKQQLEGRESGRFLRDLMVGKEKVWQILVPVFLVPAQERFQHSLERPVKTLD